MSFFSQLFNFFFSTSSPASISVSPPPSVSAPFKGTYDLLGADVKISAAQPCWTSPTKGVRQRSTWAQFETSPGVYDFSVIDAAQSLAKTNGKQLGISVAVSGDVVKNPPPAFLKDLGVAFVQLSTGSVPLMWDQILVAHYTALIAQLGARYNGSVAYVAMGGLGITLATALSSSPADEVLLDGLGGLAFWQVLCDQIIAAYAKYFPNTPILIVASRPPYQTPSGSAALNAMVDRNMALYPNLGLQHTALNAVNGKGLPFQLIARYQATHPVVFQFLTNSIGFGGLTLNGSVGDVLNSGIALGADGIEVYDIDAVNPAFAGVIADANSRLIAQ